jgi:hypothetical protein
MNKVVELYRTVTLGDSEMQIKLVDVLGAIELASNEFTYFYNKENGEVVMYADPLITGIENEELEEDLEENYDNYIRLPTKFEINQYHIMEQFIWSLPEGSNQNKLERSIQGRGAFRRFKDAVYNLGLEPSRFAYEALAYRKIAIEWCRDNGLEYQ